LMKTYLKKTGFTLVEVMVATTIGAFIALVMIGALKTVTAGAQMVEANINTAAEVRFASKTVRWDLINLYRPKNKKDTKFIAFADDSGIVPSSYMIFYTVNRKKARAQEVEGEIYEVEYYLMADEEKSVLMRRMWPNPHDDFEPGGILSVIAEDIEVFEARYFNGEEWSYEWPEEMGGVPMLIEINIVGKQTRPGRFVSDSFYVNMVRATGTMFDEDGEVSETSMEEEE